MIVTVSHWVSRAARRAFAERHIAIRSRDKIRHIRLSRLSQLSVLCFCLIVLSLVARMTASYIIADRKLAHKDALAARAELSNADLRNLVTQLEERLETASNENQELKTGLRNAELHARVYDDTRNSLTAQRQDVQSRLKGAEESLAAKSDEISRINRMLEATKTDLKLTEQQRTGLTARVHALESELGDAKSEVADLQANWQAADQKLRQLVAEHDRVTAERDRLLSRLAAMQSARNEQVNTPDRPAADKALPDKSADKLASGDDSVDADEEDAPVTPALRSVLAKTKTGGKDRSGGWGELTRVLASAGVDMDKLAARLGAGSSGQGGPYIALKDVKPGMLDAGNSDTVQKLMKTLPLTAPLAHYQLESRFGIRIDPINHRESFHSGLDFSAPFKTPVYSTAPGTVIYAGPHGEYGKVVEIDHGSGIVTRYAHLHRVTVAKGQRVTAHEQIGLLGSTGRSTGPHVHYEVLVNGNQLDPEKFLDAGKSIVQASTGQ